MKLRTRLIISFCIIIFVPILLMGVTVWGFGQLQAKGINQSFEMEESAPYEYLTNSLRMISRFTKADYEELLTLSENDPDQLADSDFLETENEDLSKRFSYLVVRKGNELIYAGDSKIPDGLRDSNFDWNGGSTGTYLDGASQCLIKQIDFSYSDGVNGKLFIVTSMEKMLPKMRNMLMDLIFSVFVILILTAGILVVWIYRGMVTPIRKLQTAAESIKEGNLDFTLEDEGGEDEFGELCQSFENMRKRLKDSAEEKLNNEKENKVLISNISHDLKTPVTAIKGYAEGIMDGVADSPEKMDKYIRTIYNKANEMDTLINELTFYSKIDTNRIPYNFNRLNVAEYFEDCVEELSLDLEAKNIGLSYFSYVEPDTKIIADPEQLRRVINNIIGNSVKYLDKEKGFISIRVKDVGDFVQVEIEDNGKGIAGKDLPYIFDRFYRTDASRNSATGGSGIGLSIVKKIVEDHGGSIWAISKENAGTTMYFVIRKYQEAVK